MAAGPFGTITSLSLAVCLGAAACSPDRDIAIESIDIIAYGVLEFDRAGISKDPASSVGAQLSHATSIRVVQQTDRIPLREGLSYGVAFRVQGRPAGAVVPIKVILRFQPVCIEAHARSGVPQRHSIGREAGRRALYRGKNHQRRGQSLCGDTRPRDRNSRGFLSRVSAQWQGLISVRNRAQLWPSSGRSRAAGST